MKYSDEDLEQAIKELDLKAVRRCIKAGVKVPENFASLVENAPSRLITAAPIIVKNTPADVSDNELFDSTNPLDNSLDEPIHNKSPILTNAPEPKFDPNTYTGKHISRIPTKDKSAKNYKRKLTIESNIRKEISSYLEKQLILQDKYELDKQITQEKHKLETLKTENYKLLKTIAQDNKKISRLKKDIAYQSNLEAKYQSRIDNLDRKINAASAKETNIEENILLVKRKSPMTAHLEDTKNKITAFEKSKNKLIAKKAIETNKYNKLTTELEALNSNKFKNEELQKNKINEIEKVKNRINYPKLSDSYKGHKSDFMKSFDIREIPKQIINTIKRIRKSNKPTPEVTGEITHKNIDKGPIIF